MNPFKGFKTMWEAKFGSRVQHPTSTAYHDGTVSRAELRGLRRLSRLIFREPVEVVPPTPFEVGPTTDDLDPKTGKRYKDWRERRALRAKVLAETYEPRDLGDLRPGDHEGWESHPK